MPLRQAPGLDSGPEPALLPVAVEPALAALADTALAEEPVAAQPVARTRLPEALAVVVVVPAVVDTEAVAELVAVVEPVLALGLAQVPVLPAVVEQLPSELAGLDAVGRY